MSSRSVNCDGPWDAIVVGSGASGGVAAMTLAEAGARVLVVEAGPDLNSTQAFGAEPGNLLRRIVGLTSGSHRQQSQHPGYWKANPRLYADERLHPYEHPADQPFLWTRGLQVGGRSLTWGGITLRLSDEDLGGVDVEGEQVRWPLRSGELSPHYAELECWLGVHGGRDGLQHLPDGETQPALAATPAEQRFAEAVRQRLGYPVIPSRGFGPAPQGEDPAWPRSSSRGSSLPRAMATGRTQLLSAHLVEPVAEVIMAMRPPTTAMVSDRQKAPNRPTLGSTPAIPEKAMASGIIAKATTRPDSRSLLGLANH